MWSSQNVCRTSACEATAKRIKSWMNDSVDPCDDFYEFACGGWIAKNPLPDHLSGTGSFEKLDRSNKDILIETMEGDYIPDKKLSKDDEKIDREIFKRLQRTYYTCMNTSAINDLGLGPIRAILEKEVGLIRQLKTFSKAYRNQVAAKASFLANAVSSLHGLGVRVLFGSDVMQDQRDPHAMSIYYSQGGLGLPSKEYYEEADTVERYTSVVRDMLALFPEFVPQERLNSVADSIVALEARLASISLPFSELQDPLTTYNPFTLSELDKNFGQYFNFRVFYEQRYSKLPQHLDYPSGQEPKFVIDSLQFFKSWSSILGELQMSNFEHYVIWQIIRTYGEALPLKSQGPLLNLDRLLSGRTKELPRNETCIGKLDSFFGFALSKGFLLKTFTREAKDAAVESIKRITTAFEARLPELDWLDTATREKALQKSAMLNNKIGYPDYVLSPRNVSDRYEGAYPADRNYLQTLVQLSSWQDFDARSKLFFPPNPADWDMTPPTVNAYYDPTKNEIVFPAGILQTPFFSSKNPNYLNYGGIGAVVGHELTHAYDNNGRHYDWYGRLNDWWTKETADKFDAKAQCFINQYGNFTISDGQGRLVHVNGKLTLGENLADNGGIARAWESWKADLKGNGGARRNMHLPGLYKVYTQEQLFFMAFAGVWCGTTRPEKQLQRIRTDPHSPAKFRVWGTVQNSKEFADAFKCKANSLMNPVQKCKIW